VAIDVKKEKLLILRDAAKHPAFESPQTQKPVHISALYRWSQGGILAKNGQRVVLEVVCTPGGLRTSEEAIARFIDALNDKGGQAPMRTRTPRQRRRHQEQTKRQLSEAGY
jgi:hypothetical protein